MSSILGDTLSHRSLVSSKSQEPSTHEIFLVTNEEAGTEVEILLDKEKALLNNGYLIRLIGMGGRLLQEYRDA
ncbi:hypothetical protein [Psychrobacillus sp. FSL K6-1415]|uniref:hypothetical protein n=1 Tax=Psychrobacillus sp. FSL K6-1415 TaxID=2921544 RepID=UPI0030F55B92